MTRMDVENFYMDTADQNYTNIRAIHHSMEFINGEKYHKTNFKLN